MNNISNVILILGILTFMPVAMAQSEHPHAVVNLVIDVSGSLSPMDEQFEAERADLANIYNALAENGLASTMFLTKDVSTSKLALYLTQLGLYGDIEFGMAGNNSDEKLSSKPYGDQLAILQSSKELAARAHVCGVNEKPISGFKPQSFDQNQDTFKALDEIGIDYNTGFQAGVLYTSGHENDVWPYLVEGHKFYAVPISTYDLSGEKVVLQDSYFKNSGLSVTQWYEALVSKFDEIQGQDEPLVISLTTSVSGSGDYLDAFKKFIIYANSKNASFVNTKQLVDMVKTGIHDVPAVQTNTTECITCNQEESTVDAQIEVVAMNSTSEVASSSNTNTTECATCGQAASMDNTV